MSVFFHWSACYPPTLRRATDHHHGQQSLVPESRNKKIQIHTLKYENAVEKEHNVNARLNKFKSADDDDASQSSSTRDHTDSICFGLIQDIIVLKSTFLADAFLFYPHFLMSTLYSTNRLNETRLFNTSTNDSWWQLTQKPYFLYIFFFLQFAIVDWFIVYLLSMAKRDLCPTNGCSYCICRRWHQLDSNDSLVWCKETGLSTSDQEKPSCVTKTLVAKV